MEKKWTAGLHLEEGKEEEKEEEGGDLKDLVLRWFTDSQATLILHDGNFPDWFQGLAARKDAEDLLRDKLLGSFLIRLSDKAFGYILSYKGLERCRHFIISQNENGRFMISGDDQSHGSLMELIEHYKVNPIQPFGEYLTSPCHQVNADELYDVVNIDAKGRSGVSVQALRALWDQNNDPHKHRGGNQRVQRQKVPAAQPPALPPKSCNRKLMGTVSAGEVTQLQGVPLVPKRGASLVSSPNGSSLESTSAETLTASDQVQKPGGKSDGDSFNATSSIYPGDICPPHFQHMVSRKSSPPGSDHSSIKEANEEEDEGEDTSNQPSSSSFTPSSPVKRFTINTYSLNDPRHSPRPSRSEHRDTLRSNPLYESNEAPTESPAQQGDGFYVKVAERPAEYLDNPYEQIPGETTAAVAQNNTYEDLEAVKTKKSKSTWEHKVEEIPT